MRKHASVPLLFFVIAAGMGLFLRWQFLLPTPGIRYTWFLHGHSHIMFLGWVLNLLYLAFLPYLPQTDQKPAIRSFVALQFLVVGMLIAFPAQGYAFYSILFTALHTIATAVLAVIFLRRTGQLQTVPMAFVRPALIFYLISTVGPFALGYLMSQGLGQTVWNNFSIYYYLHFQYNGFFTFGILALFYQLLDDKGIAYDAALARRVALWLALACIPAYALSLLFAKPGLVFNVAGAIAGLIQLWAVTVFTRDMRRRQSAMKERLHPTVYRTLQIVWFAWVAKSILQLLSAHPDIAELAFQLRPVVIAYLHLVLVGTITLFLLAWYIARGLVSSKAGTLGIILILVGFILSEALLVLTPWWGTLTGGVVSHTLSVFVFSVPMWLGALMFFIASLRRSVSRTPVPDKNQVLH